MRNIRKTVHIDQFQEKNHALHYTLKVQYCILTIRNINPSTMGCIAGQINS